MNPLFLEQVKAGERSLPADASDADRAAVKALEADDARVLARLPAKTMAANIEAAWRREPLPRPPLARRLGFVGPVAAVAASVAFFVAAPDDAGAGVPGAVIASADAGGADDVRDVIAAGGDVLKGDTQPGLLIAREEAGAAVPLSSGARVKPGDVVQVRTRGAGYAHGVVVSVDGKGHVTRHFPDSGASTALPTGTAALPFSFELDDAPRFERFFLVASHDPLDASAVEAAVAATARARDPRTAPLGGLPRGAVQADFVLVKE